MATTSFTAPPVPHQAAPELRSFLDRTLQSMAPLLNGAAQRSQVETIDGDWTFSSLVRLANTNDAGLGTTDHPFQIGPDDGLNIAFDTNEIMARSNGGASSLFINHSGGTVFVNGVNVRDAAILNNGTLADARLSSNVPLLNSINIFTVANIFNSDVYIRGRSAAGSDSAGFGQLWVRTSDAALMYTSDSGVDRVVQTA